MEKINFNLNKNTVNRNRVFIIPAGVILVSTVLFIGLVVPGIKKIFQVRQEIGSLNKQIIGLSNKLNDLRSVSETEVMGVSDVLLQAVPFYNHYFNEISTVNNLSRETNLTITGMDFSPGVIKEASGDGKTSINKLTIKIKVLGKYNDINNYVVKLENVLPLNIVDSLELESKVSTASSFLDQDIQGTMNITSQWATLPKYLGKIDSPVIHLTKEDYSLVDSLREFQSYSSPLEEQFNPGISEPIGRPNPFPL